MDEAGAKGIMTVSSLRTIPEPSEHRPWSLVVLMAVPLALSAATYYPIVRNYFLVDDFLNLFRIEDLPFVEYLLTPHGGHVLWVRNGLFYLTFKLLGPEPSCFFWTVLLTHLLNVFLLFSAIRWLTGGDRLACFGATLWGTSPLLEGTLGWYSVYGQAVVATAFLPIFIDAARLARAGRQPSRARRTLWIVLALIGGASFGVGLGLAMALPFVLLLVLPAKERRSWLPPLASLLVIVPLLYVGSHSVYTALYGKTLPASLTELISGNELRAASILFDLIAYGATQLALGFYRLAPDSFERWISYASMALLATSTFIALARGSARGRRALLAFLLTVVSCYATIAIGRAGLLPDLPTWIVVGQPRYHYVGLLTLAIFLCVVFSNLTTGLHVRPAIENFLLLLALAIVGAGFVWKRPAIDHHVEARRSTRSVLNWINARIKDAAPGDVVYFFNKRFDGVPSYLVPPAVFPGWAAVYVIFHPENSVDGKPVRFVQRSTKNRSNEGLRTASLIIDFKTWQENKTAPPAGSTQANEDATRAPDRVVSSFEIW